LTFTEDVGAIARDLLTKLLSKDPSKRLGSGEGDAKDIKNHPFFKDVNWPRLEKRAIRPPFVPEIKTSTDLRYFAKEFTEMAPASDIGGKVAQSGFSEWDGFSYAGDEMWQKIIKDKV